MNMLEVLIESKLRIIDRASLPLGLAMSPIYVCTGSCAENQSLDVFICSLPLLETAISICEHALYSSKFPGSYFYYEL